MMDHIKRNIIKLWDQWLEVNVKSSFYNVDAFAEGRNSLTDIELNELGNLANKSILHLQCHFGMDSIDLARKGAQVTGIDISSKSIREADKLARRCDQDVQFICCDVYDLRDHLKETKFDIVFTSYGVVPWLHDLGKWASVIRHFLKESGFFYLAEFHPLFYMLDPDGHSIEYPYDSGGDPLVIKNVSSYADPTIELENTEYNWAHGMSRIINSVIENRMTIEYVNEYDFSPFKLSEEMIEYNPGKWRFKKNGDLMPYVFTLKATPVV